MLARSLCVFAILVAMSFASGTPPATAQDGNGLGAVVGRHEVLLEMRSGKWLRAEPRSLDPDSLILKVGSRRAALRIAVARTDIARAWIPRRDIGDDVLRAVTGSAVSGAALELALGPDCAECGIDAGRVLRVTALSAGIGAAYGALQGLLEKSRWKLVEPANALPDRANEPYPLWSFGAAGGLGHVQAPAEAADRGYWHVNLWSPDVFHGWYGVETGALSEWETTIGGPIIIELVPFDTTTATFVGSTRTKLRSRWGYSTAQVRGRFGGGSVRPVVDLGFGIYYGRQGFTEVHRDSLGNFERKFEGSDTGNWLGANVGFGVSLGKGTVHPTLEGRFHYAGARNRMWTVIEAGATFR